MKRTLLLTLFLLGLFVNPCYGEPINRILPPISEIPQGGAVPKADSNGTIDAWLTSYYNATEADVAYLNESANGSDIPGPATFFGNIKQDRDPDILIGDTVDDDKVDTAILTSDVVLESDVDDTPVNGTTTDPISSNWAYDHANDADQHSEYMQKADNLSDVSSAATAFGNIKQDATTSATGVSELATDAETQTGTDATKAVTPAAGSSAYLDESNNLSDVGNAATARTSLGLGTMSTQDADDVNISGGIISGITSLTTIGSQTANITTVNAATYDLLTTDYILNVTYTGTGAVTSLTLPSAQVISGRIIKIKDAGGNAGTNNITIDTEGAETIDGAATYVMNVDYEAINLYSDGSDWFAY